MNSKNKLTAGSNFILIQWACCKKFNTLYLSTQSLSICLKNKIPNTHEVTHKSNVTQYHSGRKHHGVCRYFHIQGTTGTDTSIVNKCRICSQTWVTSHWTQFHRPKDHKCNFYTSENSDPFLYTRGPKTFQKSRHHLQILAIRRMLHVNWWAFFSINKKKHRSYIN
jgi:hypothetical protein